MQNNFQTQVTSNDDNTTTWQTETSNLQSQIDTINQLLIDYQLPIGTKVINNLNSDITNGRFKYGTWTLIERINNNETIVASDNTSDYLDVTSTGTDKNYPAGLQIGVSYVWKRTA